jgi:two-component system sensor histidine kinase KdpD
VPDRPQGTRPDPDALLAQVQREEGGTRTRGRLKVFLGAAAGVGKTYAMLEEARDRVREGVDVLAGVVETHGRKETEALLEGLEVLPRRAAEYRGVVLSEFDLDAALARHPQVVLVDELAHSNAPGSRHAKRWLDVEELLAAGIGVYTTVNVQHLESLNDLVARITHVVVRETVPDSVLERADEIELIDLPPDELLQRLREGKVYIPKQAQRAAQGFFRKGNLIALRQIALRKAAERVDAQMRLYRTAQGVAETWPVGERILVAVGPAPSSVQLVRAAKRMADQLRAEWIAVFVETPQYVHWSEPDRNRVWETLRLAERLGASTTTLTANRATAEILNYARRRNVSKIVVGKPSHPHWRDLLWGSKLDEVVRGSGDIDVYVISGSGEPEPARTRFAPLLRRTSRVRAYVWAVALIALATALAVATRGLVETANLAMIYLLAVVVAAARFGRGPSILASVLSVASFDWFCVPPYQTMAVADTEYLVTFAVLLVVALTISTLTTRIAQQAEGARERERRTASLYAISQTLVRTSALRDLLQAGVTHISETFDSAAVVLLPDALGQLTPGPRSGSTLEVSDQELAVAKWVFEHGQPAGMGTDTLPATGALYLPLQGAGRTIGVLGVRPALPDRFRSPEQLHLLETSAALIAVAVDQARLAEEARRIRQLEEMDRLKGEFVAVASHELRSPITSLVMEVELLRERLGATLDQRTGQLLEAAVEDARRLRALVDDLLDLSKLEAGRVVLRRSSVAVESLLEQATSAFRVRAEEQGLALSAESAPDLPPVSADPKQIARVFANLLANAIRFTPPGGRILVAADSIGEFVQFSVADNGAGIALEDQLRLFDRFVHLDRQRSQEGSGLGLAISREIVRAHGGDIWVDSGPGPGAVFSFTLPVSRNGDAHSPPTSDTDA